MIQGSLPIRRMAQDLVADVIELVKAVDVPIVKTGTSLEASERPIHVIKYLVMQALQLNCSVVSWISGNLNAALLQSARTEAEWFEILKLVLSGLPETFIILLVDALGHPAVITHGCRCFANYWSVS